MRLLLYFMIFVLKFHRKFGYSKSYLKLPKNLMLQMLLMYPQLRHTYATPIEDFQYQQSYDLILMFWGLCQVHSDVEVLQVLTRAKDALTGANQRGTKSGIILIKENAIEKGERNPVNEHKALDRTDKQLIALFYKAGLELVYEPDFHSYTIENAVYESKYWALRRVS